MDQKIKYVPRKEVWAAILKIGFLLFFSIFMIVFIVVNINDRLRSKAQFQSWYSQFGKPFANISKTYCSREFDIYLHGTRKTTTKAIINGSEPITIFVEPMINCVLSYTSPYILSALGSAQVMLGLTPTLIALLGASSEEVCLVGLIGRRRFLALLLAAASPSIYTNRAFEYRDPDAIIKERLRYHHVDWTIQVKTRKYFVVLEYTFALAALTNVVTVSWQLGVYSINGVSPNVTLMPMLWILLAVPAHLSGAIIFNLRARRAEKHKSTSSESRGVEDPEDKSPESIQVGNPKDRLPKLRVR